MKGKHLVPFLCVAALGALSIVSCEMVTLDDEPVAVADETGGYPSIQGIINESLDAALHVVANAAARSVAPDTRYATFESVLRRARAADLATARALDLPGPADVTEEELRKIEELLTSNPHLDAQFEPLVRNLEAKYTAIPPIEVGLQKYGADDKPVGTRSTIRSADGVVDFGDQALTSQEFLLIAQAAGNSAGRGFVMGPYYWSGKRHKAWPVDTVNYFFDRAVPSANKTWMRGSIARMSNGTGMRFREGTWLWWHEFWWNLGASNYLRISIRSLSGDVPGRASVGKIGASFLYIDRRRTDEEDIFNHEMGHVFGLLHEHQRSDRDEHIFVHTTGASHDIIARDIRWCWSFLGIQFSCSTQSRSNTYGTPYDYNSVMHYPANEINKITSRSSRPWTGYGNNRTRWGRVNGNTYFSPWDIYVIKRLYGISPNARPTYTPAP